MSPADRIVAAVAWCDIHQAAVWFTPAGVRIRVQGRTVTRASFLEAVGAQWDGLPA